MGSQKTYKHTHTTAKIFLLFQRFVSANACMFLSVCVCCEVFEVKERWKEREKKKTKISQKRTDQITLKNRRRHPAAIL